MRVRMIDVRKSFGKNEVVKNLSLDVADGEFLVLLGESGCGKTTALRMVAGLETVSGGTIEIGDHDVTNVLPKYRNVAMVFQSYALYPHMTVAKNIGYPLKLRGTPAAELDGAVYALRQRRCTWKTCCIAIRASSPAASASGWRWRAPWCARRRRS